MKTHQIIAILALAGAALVSAASCIQGGNEGDRCNPLLSHNECDNGLTCQQPSGCAENYCCPADLTHSTSSFCRSDPAACPLEAGVDAGTGDATPEASSDADASDAGGD